MSKKNSCTLMSSSSISIPCLKYLANSKIFTLNSLVSNPDKAFARNKKPTPSELKKEATKLGIKILQPKSLKNQTIFQTLKNLNSDIFIVFAYGKILPKKILDLPKIACLNIHTSILPNYRGPAPINASILNGDKITGITVIHMNDRIDEGDILLKKHIPIVQNETTLSLTEKLSKLAVETLKNISKFDFNKKLAREKQNHKNASHTKKITKEDGFINWKNSAQKINKQIHAYHPWPSSSTAFFSKFKNKNINLKILPPTNVEKINTTKKNGSISEINKKSITIQCGESSLIIKKIQIQGKKIMSVSDFINGYKISNSDTFISLNKTIIDKK